MFKALQNRMLKRYIPNDKTQRLLMSVIDYGAGSDRTIAADLFKLGVGGKIEHEGEEYVFTERKTEAVPYLFPSLANIDPADIERLLANSLEVDLDTIHKALEAVRWLNDTSH